MEGRTLRSKQLRTDLWIAANGKCQRCGKQLPENWHADHIIPWSTVKETEFSNMQALCPECNLKKGDFSMNLSNMRPGQLKAIDVIFDRFVLGEKLTSIILPTRYGKSDVIFCAMAKLFSEGKICGSLVLSPTEFLAEQLVDLDKVRARVDRYNIGLNSRNHQLKYKRLYCLPSVFLNPNKEFLLSTTIQLVCGVGGNGKNVDRFAQLIDEATNRTGLPFFINVDESHTGSEDNTWGKSYIKLVEGCRNVRGIAYTATAIRADGKIPPGFRRRVKSTFSQIVSRSRKTDDPMKIKIELYDNEFAEYEIEADHETTFGEAWDENPPVLCNLDLSPYDVNLSDLTESPDDSRKLSDLSSSEARRILGKIIRNPKVVREGVKRMVEYLRVFRSNCPEVTAIVFCGNDEINDPEEPNVHARQIAKEIKNFDPSLKVVIATSASEDDAKKLIELFAKGSGDILIVKQMASLGLDASTLKVELDLSPTRQIAAQIQRDMRVATLHKGLKFAVKICPADPMAIANFEKYVQASNGGKVLVGSEFIRDFDVPVPLDQPDDRPIYIVNGTGPADFSDTLQNRCESIHQGSAEKLFEAFPEFQAFMSRAAAMNRFKTGGLMVVESAKKEDYDCADVDSDLQPLRDEINDIAKELVNRMVRYKPGDKQSSKQFGMTMGTVHRRARIEAGLDPDLALEQIGSIADMRKLRDEFRRMGSQ